MDFIRRLSALTRSDRVRRFKIGITNKPKARAAQPDYSEHYDEMIVLYRTRSLNFVRQAETRLVKHYQPYQLCRNINAGGGGNFGEPPYFLYVVIKRRNV